MKENGKDKKMKQNMAHEKLVEELQIHQLELEQQNLELRRSEDKLNRLRNDLEASRSRYYSLFNMAPVGYVVYSDDFRIREGNEKFCRLVDSPLKKLLHERIYSYVDRGDQDVFHFHIQNLKANTHSQCIVRLVGNKQALQVKMVSSYHYDRESEEMLYYSALLDITKSMEQQKALEHLEQKYAKLIDRTETAFVELSQDDEVLSYNSQFADMAGEKGGDGLKGQKISKWLPEAYSLREHLENKDEGSGKKGFRLKMHTHTGLTKSLSARAEMIGPGSKGGNNIYAFLTDISREEELEQRVRQSNEQYQQLFEASKDGIVSAGTDKRITNANQAFLDIVGYALEEIREMHYSEFTHEGSIAKDEDVMQNQVAVRGYSEEYEKEYVRKDGSTVPVSLKIVSLNDKMGKTVQFWAIVRDISEKKRQERKLQEANENLQEMIYIASHDLQVPLISMESFASELLEEHSDKLGEEGKYALLRVKKNAERMHNLVISLLNMSRLNTHENPFVPLNMKALAEQVINDLSLTMNEAGACITLEKLPLCIGDKTRITTLFRNLLTNSINYGAKRILIGHREGRYFVEDNGIGIPPDQLERVFKPGERLKMNQAEGVGMGLTFCKKVVQKHEGRIWAESDGEGRGATIYFTLPMKNETKRNDHEQIHRHIANGRR